MKQTRELETTGNPVLSPKCLFYPFIAQRVSLDENMILRGIFDLRARLQLILGTESLCLFFPLSESEMHLEEDI